jgi:hypothetical protein
MAFSYFDYWYDAISNYANLPMKPKEKFPKEQKQKAHQILGSIRRHYGMDNDDLYPMLVFGFVHNPLALKGPEQYAQLDKQWAVAEEFRKWRKEYKSFIDAQPNLLSAIRRYKQLTEQSGEVDITCLR